MFRHMEIGWSQSFLMCKIRPLNLQKCFPLLDPMLSQLGLLFFLLQWLIEAISRGTAQRNGNACRNDTDPPLLAGQMHTIWSFNSLYLR